jgi:hypothetical protein
VIKIHHAMGAAIRPDMVSGWQAKKKTGNAG